MSFLDQLEMLIGRSINNYSVHVAFLDRFDQMDLHKLRHIGWQNKSGLNMPKTDMTNYLKQFEKSVTYLLNAYSNTNNSETRCSVIKTNLSFLFNSIFTDSKFNLRACS